MKVSKLIQQLSHFNGDAEVKIYTPDPKEHFHLKIVYVVHESGHKERDSPYVFLITESKPQSKSRILKWKWVYLEKDGSYNLTGGYYSEEEIKILLISLQGENPERISSSERIEEEEA